MRHLISKTNALACLTKSIVSAIARRRGSSLLTRSTAEMFGTLHLPWAGSLSALAIVAAVCWATAALADSKLYAVGGLTSTNVNVVGQSDPATNTWSANSLMSTSRLTLGF